MKKMFGFVTAASDLLSEENKIRYRGWYCGLCRSLGAVCGQSSRLLLNYDMAFLAMLLSSVHRLPETAEECSCPAHPLKKHLEIRTSASDYSADMNVILSYYKLMDDWHDDKNPAALAAASAYASKCHELEEKYPRQAQAIATCLENVSELEQDGECNPDLPANCFGRLMGELFVMEDGIEYEQELRAFGRTLGRFIYVMDAATDLHSDVKHERYNCLTGTPSDEIYQILQVMGGDFMRCYRKLPLSADTGITDNILTAGVWQKYAVQKRKQAKKENDKEDGKKSV